MPMKPPKACRTCKRATRNTNGYCDKHQVNSSGWQRRQIGTTTTKRGYGWSWQQARERILIRDKGLCQPCFKEGRYTSATAVDHIINKAAGGSDDDRNLQAICTPCHAGKTQAESLRGGG